jgi:hypothetical protein
MSPVRAFRPNDPHGKYVVSFRGESTRFGPLFVVTSYPDPRGQPAKHQVQRQCIAIFALDQILAHGLIGSE